MNEQERIAKINQQAGEHLQDWLEQLENEEVTTDGLLAALYGGMVTAHLLGYNLETLINDAKAGGDRLLKVFEETEKEQLTSEDN